MGSVPDPGEPKGGSGGTPPDPPTNPPPNTPEKAAIAFFPIKPSNLQQCCDAVEDLGKRVAQLELLSDK